MTGKYLGILVWQTRRVIVPTAPHRGRQVASGRCRCRRPPTISSHPVTDGGRNSRPAVLRRPPVRSPQEAKEVMKVTCDIRTCVKRRCSVALEQHSCRKRAADWRAAGGSTSGAGSSGPRPRPALHAPAAPPGEPPPLTSAKPPDASPYLARTQLACHLCVTLATD